MFSSKIKIVGLVLALALSACAQPTPVLPPPPTAQPAPTPEGPVVRPSTGIQPNPSVGGPVVRPPAQVTPVANAGIPPTPAPSIPKLSLPYTPVSGDAAAVIDQLPAEGERLDPDGSVTLYFDRAMNPAAVERAFKTQPTVAGAFAWSDGGRKVVFKPATSLPRGTVLDIGLAQDASAADGAPLRQPFIARFLMKGNLEVAQTIPADGAIDVVPEIPITVLFNRPVVPLSIVSQGAGAPSQVQPLSFDPPIEGKAEWLNTSILVFRPSSPLPGGTVYRARIDGSLRDVDGNPLAAAVEWTFSTNAPKVLSVTPDTQTRARAPVDTIVTARFNQDIDPASARSAFALLDPRGGSVAGNLTVFSNTLTFTPSARLDFDAAYSIRVAAGVKSLYGGLGSREAWQSAFSTYPKPRVIGTQPINGAKDVYPYGGISIQFSAPVDPASVWARLRISPAVSLTRAFTSYYEFDNVFNAQVFLDPSTDYTVDLLPGVSDRWGNTIAETTSFQFRTAQLPPYVNLSLNASGGTYNAYLPVRVIATSNNVATLNLELYALSETDVTNIRQRSFYDTRQSVPGRVVRTWQVKVTGQQNRIARTLLTLGEGDGRLTPGGYVLRLVSPDLPAQNQQNERRALLFVSELNLTEKRETGALLVWATDLKTGQPVPQLALRAFETRFSGNTQSVFLAGSGSTGADGVARFPVASERSGSAMLLSSGRFGIVFEEWGSGINPGDFGLGYGGIGPESSLRGFIYTDRGIYRPGQTVKLRGIVRSDDDGMYSPAPAGLSVQVQANGPGGQLLSRNITLDEFGAFDAEIVLPADTAVGTVAINAQSGNRFAGSASFTIAEYRPPEYEVVVTPSSAAVARGSTLNATLAANYLSGGGLANARMSWNVVASQATFDPPQLGQYSFSDADNPWTPYRRAFFETAIFRPGRSAPPLIVARGEGVTDGAGQLQISVPVSTQFQLASGAYLSGPVQFSIEGNASGADGQSIAGRASVIVHPAALYVGVASGGAVVRMGKPLAADLVVVDWAGVRLPGREIEVSLVRREWKNTFNPETGSWTSAVVDEDAGSQKVVSGPNGEARVSFTPEKGGSYRIVARTRDPQGRISQSARFVFVVGDQYVSWLREDNDRINLVADRAEYVAGDTAEILIPSPFAEDHLALVTVERGRIVQHEIIPVKGGTAVYRLPIIDRFAPNVFVSVVVMKGMTGAGAVGADLADYKIGMVELTVKPVAQVISITLTPERRLLQPGETVEFAIRATDAGGKPVAAAFSIDVVDKGVLNLKPRTANAIVEAFYGRRAPGTQMALTLNQSMNRRFAEEEQNLAQDQSGEKASGAPAGTAAPAAAPAPGALRQAGAGESAPPPEEAAIRENFADTAYWAPNVRTNAAGEGKVSVKLPDNLTTWVVRAVGADNQTRVGEGLTDAVATLPVLIRPVTPRFLVVGDVVELGAIVQNNSAEDQTVRAWLAESVGLRLETALTMTSFIEAGKETLVTWRATVLDVPQVNLLFRAASEKYGDASRPRLSTAPNGGLKVLRYSAREIVGTSGVLDTAGTRSELVVLPPLLDDSQGSLSLRLDHSLIAATQAGLTYLDEYRYETAESIASRLMANVLSYQLLTQFPQPDPALQAQLKAGIATGIDKLVRLQHSDGGWSWWREGESNPHVALWASFALARARQAGFTVNPSTLERGLAYARQIVKTTSTLRGTWAFNQQAYALYVLGESGAGDRAKVIELYEGRDNLGLYGRALLALTLGKNDPKDARLKTLFADLNRDAVLSATGAHWEEKQPDWWAFNSNTRSTALVVSALARFDPQNALAPNAVRWLMAGRTEEGIWKSTYESAWVMISLIDWATATGELKANYDYSALLNGKRLGQGVATRETLAVTQIFTTPIAGLLRETANRLTLERSAGEGRLYYTVHLRAALPASAVKAIDRGIIVQRRYTLASCADGPKCPSVTSAKVGDELRVSLTLIAPSDLRNVQLEDTLPAGAEAVDTGLATTSQLATGVTGGRTDLSRWYGWWWNWYARAEVRDDRVALFAPYLSRGTYEYSYTIRVTTAGRFNVIPTIASDRYFPEVFGRGDGELMVFER